MTTYNKELLSGSTSGRPILITATGSTGTAIHTAVAGASDFDEMWLYAGNTSEGVDNKLTVEFGGTTDPDDIIEVNITGSSGLSLIVPGVPVNGGVTVRAYAATGSQLNVIGWVNAIRS